VYFPREIFPFSSTLVSLVDFAVSSVVLIGLMAYYRIGLTPAVLFLPVVLSIHVIFTVGVALLLAMSNLFYRDVKYLFEIVLTVWMFVTSVLYPVGLVGGKLGLLMRANPMTSIIDGYRAVLLFGTSPLSASFTYAACASLALLFVSWLVFHRAEFQFAENV
jgi:ABC-type polysaccharide/polyol phosphate export permease